MRALKYYRKLVSWRSTSVATDCLISTLCVPDSVIRNNLRSEGLAKFAGGVTRNSRIPHPYETCETNKEESLTGVSTRRERKNPMDSLSYAYERFWDLYPESQRWQGESALVEKVFRRVAKSIGPNPELGAGVLLARAAKYASDFEGSTLNPHNPIRWLEAKGQLDAPNDHRGRSKMADIDLKKLAAGITVRPDRKPPTERTT